MDDFSESSSKLFMNLSSKTVYSNSIKKFYANFQLFHQISQDILKSYYDFLSQEIDSHFERQIEKIEKSLAKFDPNILGFIEPIKILNTYDDIEDMNLDELVEKLNLINLDFIDLDQKIRFLTEKINTCFSASYQRPVLKFSNLNLVKNYDTEELPNPDIDKILKIEAKRSSILNSKPIDFYINKIKNASFSNSFIDLEPLGSEVPSNLIKIYEKIVDRLSIGLRSDLGINIYIIDENLKLNCLMIDQDSIVDGSFPNDDILKLDIFDFKVLDNGHLVTAETNNTLSIWEIDYSRRKIASFTKKIDLLIDPNSKISIIKYAEKLGIAIVKENSEKVELWCLESGLRKVCLHDHAGYVQSAAFLSDTQLIAGSNSDQVIAWNLTDWQNPAKQCEYNDSFYLDSIKKIKIVRDKKRIVTQNDKNKIIVFDYDLNVIFKIFDEYQSDLSTMKPMCMTNNELIRVDGTTGWIQVYGIESGLTLGVFRDRNTEYSLFRTVNDELITVSSDGTLSKWTVNPNSRVNCFHLSISLKKIKFYDPSDRNNDKPVKLSVTQNKNIKKPKIIIVVIICAFSYFLDVLTFLSEFRSLLHF
ncbi:(Myosin heavy-chain) kinase [Brachionus plicatilis]|uniref:(Myosin heavy-chain) kinase n=1 Tax=Brachionus plicatilis TaxID=10195 RepID=A0A3M7S7S2_BRAPC|nr:(Myosin heavy-chain) kinase [Brachionus plicatilis]